MQPQDARRDTRIVKIGGHVALYNNTMQRSKPCPNCGLPVGTKLRHPRRLAVAIALWTVPLGFLSQGYWPFGLFPTALVTIWAILSNARVCSSCGHAVGGVNITFTFNAVTNSIKTLVDVSQRH